MEKYTQAGKLMKITTPFEDDFLLINSLKVDEGISQLFEMEVELLHQEKDDWPAYDVIDAKKILGQAVSINIDQGAEGGRMFNGLVSRFSQGSRARRFTQYWITVVPFIWVFTQSKQSRIFQQKTVKSIIEEVFKGFENAIKWELDYDYKPRNYCVQYRESDFDFASRIMEEEGIYYYFEHTDDGAHKMIISDKPQFSRDFPVKSELKYMLTPSMNEAFESMVLHWETDYKLGPGQTSFRDHNIQQPGKNLEKMQPTKFEVGGNKDWEVYDYPGGYARKFDGITPSGGEGSDLDNIAPDGERTSQIAMAIVDAGYMTGDGRSNCSSVTPGFRFKMSEHSLKDLNGQYVITSVSHEAVQAPAYEEGDKSTPSDAYSNTFRALSHGRAEAVPFRPIRKTEKPVVYGSQTALVVGSGSEEIFTDKYGRIKVQFYWDRQGQGDGLDSCWVPVAQAWAGNTWGSMFIPRCGMEVLVHFLEGDPDQPMATGCVYHPGNMPPYPLPEHKTKSTIKSNSTKGGGGFNEFRIDDEKGKEQIFIHGQKSLDVRIKSDRRELIGNDRHLIVKRDKREWIERDVHSIVDRHVYESIGVKDAGDYHREVKGKIAFKTGGGVSHDIGGSLGEKIGGSHSEEAGQDIYIKAGMKIVIEAGAQLTLKGPGGFIDIGPSGIAIQGTMVLINSGGAAGVGQAVGIVPPTKPEEAHIADNADPGSTAPTYKNQIKKLPARKLPTFKKPSHKPDPKKLSWIEVYIEDEKGNPVPGERYRVTLPDGNTIAEGTTDDKGVGRVSGIDPGNCKITFPELDDEAWNPK